MNQPTLTQNAMQNWERAAPEEQQGEPLPVFDYLQILWYRRKLIVAVTLFVALAGWVHVNQIRSIYTASATLMLGIQPAKVLDIDAAFSRDYYGDHILAEMEVLRSRGLARKVVERLNLQNYEEFNPGLREPEESLFDFLTYLDPRTWVPAGWKQSLKEAFGQETITDPPGPATPGDLEEQKLATATSIFLGKLAIEEVALAGVVIVRFSSWDRNLAARIANEIPEAYIIDQLESRFEATEKANTWLSEQLQELEAKVAQSERAVEIFREDRGLARTAGTGLLDTQLSELNSQLIVARAGRAEVQARLAQINRMLAAGGQGVETLTEVLSSSLVQQLRSLELQAASRISELSVEFGPKHPRMLQAQAELQEVRERIGDEIRKVAAGLENEAEFSSARVASLEASLREAQGASSEQDKEGVQLRALEREASANRALFETFLGRFKETSSTQSMATSDARVLSQAEVPGGPSYPNRKQKLLTIMLMGFLGGSALAFVLNLLNPGLRSPEAVQQALGVFVIGVIPLNPGKQGIHNYVLDKPKSGVVEALNSLKFSLALSNPDIQVKTVQVTSSVPAEGKTSLALALARVEAASGKKVILVDGDLRRSSIVRKLGLEPGHKGLSDLVVAGETGIDGFIMRDVPGNMDYMPIGTAEFANAGDIFSSHRMHHILEQLRDAYDLVIIDSPPVMAVTDARIIGRLVDKTLFVVRWGKTPAKVVRTALHQLQHYGTDLAGIVLQQVDLQRYGRFGYDSSGYYYHHGRYGKYYS